MRGIGKIIGISIAAILVVSVLSLIPKDLIKDDTILQTQGASALELDGDVSLIDSDKLANLSLPFIKNQGQLNQEVKFYANTFAGTVFVTEDGLTYSIITNNSDDESFESFVVRERFAGSSNLQLAGTDKSETVVNYFVGEKENWRSNIPSYNAVSLGEPWPSIDVLIRANGANVEKIFKVKPGGSVDDIQIEIDGISALKLSENGELVLITDKGELSMSKPIAYQYVSSAKVDVEVEYLIKDTTYGFIVKEYDPRYELIIDPLLASTFLGGSDGEFGPAITTDGSGNVFVVSSTTSTDFPTAGSPFDSTYNG